MTINTGDDGQYELDNELEEGDDIKDDDDEKDEEEDKDKKKIEYEGDVGKEDKDMHEFDNILPVKALVERNRKTKVQLVMIMKMQVMREK